MFLTLSLLIGQFTLILKQTTQYWFYWTQICALVREKTNVDIILGKCHTRMQCASVSVLQLMYDVLTHQIYDQQFLLCSIHFNNKENT